jgi:hypothetical protein
VGVALLEAKLGKCIDASIHTGHCRYMIHEKHVVAEMWDEPTASFFPGGIEREALSPKEAA